MGFLFKVLIAVSPGDMSSPYPQIVAGGQIQRYYFEYFLQNILDELYFRRYQPFDKWVTEDIVLDQDWRLQDYIPYLEDHWRRNYR